MFECGTKMFKQYLSLVLLCAVYNAKVVLSTDASSNATYAHVLNQNKTHSEVNTVSNSTVLTEGGKINITTVAHQEREHVAVTTIKPIVVTNKTVALQPISILKDISHNNTIINASKATNVTNTFKNATITATNATIAATNATTIKNATHSYPMDVNGDSKIKPRKGVNMSEATAVEKSTPSSTTTFVPKKPTVTFGSDDDPAPQKQSNTRVILDNKVLTPNRTDEKPSSVLTEDEVVGRFTKRHPDYVLPIVLTILAVPLLAIILTVLWKRGAEWWYHRHYRRMDFLIDGMYNN